MRGCWRDGSVDKSPAVALVFAIVRYFGIMSRDAGTQAMQDISKLVQDGAAAVADARRIRTMGLHALSRLGRCRHPERRARFIRSGGAAGGRDARRGAWPHRWADVAAGHFCVSPT